MIIQSKPCPGCSRVLELDVPEEAIERWRKGMLIQKALPSLTSSERESLVTGYCDPCWDKLFNEDAEDE